MRTTLATTLTLALALPAAALPSLVRASDAEVYDRAIELAGYVCPGHTAERTRPGVRAVKVDGLRVLEQRGYILCPDTRVSAPAAVIWYPKAGVLTSNPETPASVRGLAAKVDELTRKQAFATETSTWDAQGKTLTGQTLPMFEPRPEATQRTMIR